MKRKTTTRTAVGDADGETSKKNRPQTICFKRSDEKHHSVTRVTPGLGHERAVPRLRTQVQRVRTDRVREGREFNETGKEKQGEKNAYFQMEEICAGYVGRTVLRKCCSRDAVWGR